MKTQDLIDILDALKEVVEEVDFEGIILVGHDVVLTPYKEGQ